MSFLLLIGVLSILFVGQVLYESDIHDNTSRDIVNFTESSLVWNYSIDNLNTPNIGVNRLSNIIHKTIDWFGFIGFEVAKWGLEFGYNNPQYDFKFLADFMIKIVLLIIIITVLTQIIPLIAVGYLIVHFTIKGVKKLYYKIKERKRDE